MVNLVSLNDVEEVNNVINSELAKEDLDGSKYAELLIMGRVIYNSMLAECKKNNIEIKPLPACMVELKENIKKLDDIIAQNNAKGFDTISNATQILNYAERFKASEKEQELESSEDTRLAR